MEKGPTIRPIMHTHEPMELNIALAPCSSQDKSR
jgi:hypothetical protein